MKGHDEVLKLPKRKSERVTATVAITQLHMGILFFLKWE